MREPKQAKPGPFVHLDLIRGLAALLVLLAHLRQLVFQPYKQLTERGPLEAIVWGISSFGYEAVMVFFVLSGFFITRSVILDSERRDFSWNVYLIKRLSRLWTVLIPCLVATLIWDSLNIFLTGSAYGSEDLGLSAFLKNCVFLTRGTGGLAVDFFGYPGPLSMISAPTYGSNAPLWSLTNEFWYYVLFPLLYLAATRRRTSIAIVYCSLFVAGCLFIGESLVFYGFVWGIGAICYTFYHHGLTRKLRGSLHLTTAIIAFSAALVISKLHFSNEYCSNVLVGLAASYLILVLANCAASGDIYLRLARAAADASYTIYLAHFPFLLLVANVAVVGQRFNNSASGYATFTGIGAVVILYCYLMYCLFEKHTDRVRGWCLAKFAKRAAAPMPPEATSVGLGRSH